ncbi:hypothetical protein EUGRSUZ_H01017 [Eucalyptus grandis]|uniref:Uncharacterized protein n=2 Tax=Eucalyptus grandis TaxID=71139 RepID=A0ACC3JNW1_EUCGR|nr:hypothetical protein EUGRSUZ_H01017 [Eucalyptus grandis]
MRSWKEWASFAIETGGLAFAHLQQLCIRNCPRLSGGLPGHLPSLTALSIRKCPQLASSLPIAPLLREIKLDDCGKVSGVEPLINGIELRDMEIKNLSTLPSRFLPPTMTRLHLEGCHEIELPIHRCHESLQYLNLWRSCDSLISFPLEIFPSLKKIQLLEIQNLERLSNSDGSPLLSMYISCSPSFFRSLKISSCSHLESFPERGLPSKLVALSLFDCDKLITSRQDWEGQIPPPSLTSLVIFNVGLKSLDNLGLHHLTCLKNFRIVGCGSLRSMPMKGLSSSLSNLFVHGCPLLAKRCQRKKGKDWLLVSHIRCTVIEGVLVT